jgi:hypothetical protein
MEITIMVILILKLRRDFRLICFTNHLRRHRRPMRNIFYNFLLNILKCKFFRFPLSLFTTAPPAPFPLSLFTTAPPFYHFLGKKK